MCPVTPTAAIPHDHDPDINARTIEVNGQVRPYGDEFVWPGLVGMVFLPAAVVPVGHTSQGPVGLQIVAPHLEDRTAVDVARRISEVLGDFRPPPEPSA
jgi:amidase